MGFRKKVATGKIGARLGIFAKQRVKQSDEFGSSFCCQPVEDHLAVTTGIHDTFIP